MLRLLVAVGLVTCFAGALRAGVGTSAPDFEFLRTWNMPGNQMRLSDFRGKPVLLETFATWCPHCPGAIPQLRSAHETYAPGGLTVLAVSSEDSFLIEPYLNQYGVNYPVARAFGVGQLYGQTGVPHAWLINAAGTIVWEGHTSQIPDSQLSALAGAAPLPGIQQAAPPQAESGDSWWIWLIIAPALLFAGAMGWFLWSTKDRTINYQTQIYQAPPGGARPPQPPSQPQSPPVQYGVPQAFPGTPGSSTIQEPYQGNRPGSKPNTRAIPRSASTTQTAMPVPIPEQVELPPEPPPKAEHYFGQKPASDFPPFDTNRNPQRGR